MIDLNNQNWVEGFVKESADLGLDADETKRLLAHAAHLEMYKSSEAYRDGFAKEAGKYDWLGPAIAKHRGVKSLKQPPPAMNPNVSGGVNAMGKPIKPTTAAKPKPAPAKPAPKPAPAAAAAAGKTKAPASDAAAATADKGKKMTASKEQLQKAKDQAAKSRGEKAPAGGGKQPPKDTAGETAAAGGEQAKSFFGNAGTRLGNLGRYGAGAGLLYGGLKGKELLDEAYMDSEDRFVRDLLENQGRDAVEDYFYQQSRRDFDKSKRYAFANQGSDTKNFYRPKDYWAGSGN